MLKESGVSSTYFVYLYFNAWAYYLERHTFSFMNDLILPFEERCGYYLQYKLIWYMNLNHIWPIKDHTYLVSFIFNLLSIFNNNNLHYFPCFDFSQISFSKNLSETPYPVSVNHKVNEHCINNFQHMLSLLMHYKLWCDFKLHVLMFWFSLKLFF